MLVTPRLHPVRVCVCVSFASQQLDFLFFSPNIIVYQKIMYLLVLTWVYGRKKLGYR